MRQSGERIQWPVMVVTDYQPRRRGPNTRPVSMRGIVMIDGCTSTVLYSPTLSQARMMVDSGKARDPNGFLAE